MAVSELPGNPNAVWTVRRHVEGIHHLCPLGNKCIPLLRMYPLWENVSDTFTRIPFKSLL